MAELTEQRYAESRGKKQQFVGCLFRGRLVPPDPASQTGMTLAWMPEKDGVSLRVEAVYTDSTHTARTTLHAKNRHYLEVVSGPLKKVDETTFRLYPYEAGWDNPRRSFSVVLVAVGDADADYRGCVQPISITLPTTVRELVVAGP